MRAIRDAGRRSALRSYVAAIAAAAATAGSASADIGTWKTVDFVSSNWNNPDNWQGGFVPGSTSGTTNTDIAQFPGPNSTVTLDANRNIEGVFLDHGFTVSGGSFVLSNAGIIRGGSTVTVNSPIVLAAVNSESEFVLWDVHTASVTGAGGAGTSAALELFGNGSVSGPISDGPNGGKVGILLQMVNGAGAEWTLSGNNTYTGNTKLFGNDFSLRCIGSNAWAPVLNGPGTTDISGGTLKFDYSNGSPDPVSTVLPILAASAGTGWATGQIYSTAANGSGGNANAIGYFDDTANQVLKLMYTLPADANLDGSIDTVDFNLLAASFGLSFFSPSAGVSPNTWAAGDFDYSGTVDTIDFNLLAASFGKTLNGDLPQTPTVPEPMSVGLFGLLLLRRRVKRA